MSLLNRFCSTFAAPCDPRSLYDLDSTNEEKFSKHIIVKKLLNGEMLAFENNAQAGYFVKQFMDFVRARHEDGDGLARQLFVSKAKKGEEPRADELVSVVDESV